MVKKIKPKKEKKVKARFRSINVPEEIWAHFVDFLWAGVMNVNPDTTTPQCVEYIQGTVMDAIDKGTVKIEDGKIKLK